MNPQAMPSSEPNASAASAAAPPRILVADDQPAVREALRLLLKPAGYAIETASSPAALLAAIERSEFDLVLMDLNYARDTTSGREGLDLISRLQQIDSTLPIVVMTAWSTVDIAVEAMHRGARDFVQKPWENPRLLTILRNQIELASALRRSRRLEAANQLLQPAGAPPCIAESAAMRPLMQRLRQFGPSEANVLITGEHGVGKEVIARQLHALSPRAARPLISVNLGALPEGTFASELFGHVRGAFTDARADRIGRFELADQGTLFLDEVANISPAQQAQLLRVLQTGELERLGSSRTLRVRVRVLSATNADLRAEVAAGRFREDLLFRLNTVELAVPPLRLRREDIPLLAAHFLREFSQRYQRQPPEFSPAAMRRLLDYGWPGNVRELEHVVERALLLAGGERIEPGDLGLDAAAGATPRWEEMRLDEAERYLIEKTMERCQGNIYRTAQALGISRSALYRRLQRDPEPPR